MIKPILIQLMETGEEDDLMIRSRYEVELAGGEYPA